MLRAFLTGDYPMPDYSGDPSGLWKEANIHGVELIAFKDADISDFEDTLRAEIKRHVLQKIKMNFALAAAHSSVSTLLTNGGIPHAMIKGCISSLYYSTPDLRRLGDVDFVVDKCNFDAARALLTENGYRELNVNHKIHIMFEKNGIRYEMHSEPPGIPDGERGEGCRRYLADLTRDAVVRDTVFGRMSVPSVFHHGLIVLLHTAHHMSYSGIGLRQLCDWAVFEGTLTEDEFMKMFEAPLRETGLYTFENVLTAVCEKYLGSSPKAHAQGADELLVGGLLSDVLSGGNFGQRNTVRSHEAYLITAGKTSRSMPERFIRALLDMIYLKWPLSKKLKILVPFGWAFYGARYVVRIIAGKRPKLRIRAAVKGAEARNMLYKGLHLFEPTEVKK